MTLGDRVKSLRARLNENFGTRYKTTMMRFKSTFVYRSYDVKRAYQEIYEAISGQ